MRKDDWLIEVTQKKGGKKGGKCVKKSRKLFVEVLPTQICKINENEILSKRILNSFIRVGPEDHSRTEGTPELSFYYTKEPVIL